MDCCACQSFALPECFYRSCKIALAYYQKIIWEERKRLGYFSQVFSFPCTQGSVAFVGFFSCQPDTLTWLCTFSITLALPSRARVVLTVGTLVGFRFMFRGAATWQRRRDQARKLKKELVWGVFLFSESTTPGCLANAACYSFPELHLKYDVFIWPWQHLPEERQHASIVIFCRALSILNQIILVL